MKRIFDILAITLSFFILIPIVLLVSLMVKFKLGSPIFFKQFRPGLNGKVFNMIKFRTMTCVCDENADLLPDSQRLTKFGKFLRSTSLDELPGLWCVVKGDMSLVGPRPLLVEYLPLYTEKQSKRHEVKPGITGWAQVNGRNAISWEEKFELDVWYVDNQSFWLDTKILYLTVLKVFRREGIRQQGHVTMEGFKGE